MRRRAERAIYDERIGEILRSGLVAHVAVQTAEGPVVLPMAYGVDQEDLYLHGALGNALLKAAVGHDICVTVTIIDGLVIARSAFHNSMNYRSVVVRGTARRVDDHEKVHALRLISDHVVETWRFGRAPTASEMRATAVLAVALTEASAKVRSGDPIDEPSDVELDHWAGVVPIATVFGPPQPAADLRAGIEAATSYER